MSVRDVCVIGSANLDLVATVAHIPRPGQTLLSTSYFETAGGKGLNQAIAAARCGARTAFVGCLGSDPAAQALLDAMAAEAIDLGAVERVDAPTGRAMIAVAGDGENAIVVVAGANALLSPASITRHASTIAGSSIVLAQLEVPLPSVLAGFAIARDNRRTTVLNPAPAQPLPHELLQLVDVLVPNEDEAAVLGRVSDLIDAGVRTVVVTEGARGARLVTRASESRVAPFAVASIDSTAAGDSFCGALAARLGAGEDLERSLAFAAAAGALATTRAGAAASIPSSSAIEALLRSAR